MSPLEVLFQFYLLRAFLKAKRAYGETKTLIRDTLLGHKLCFFAEKVIGFFS